MYNTINKTVNVSLSDIDKNIIVSSLKSTNVRCEKKKIGNA